MLRHRLPLLLVLLLLVACGRAPEAVDTDTDSAPASTVTTVVERATVDAPAAGLPPPQCRRTASAPGLKLIRLFKRV